MTPESLALLQQGYSPDVDYTALHAELQAAGLTATPLHISYITAEPIDGSPWRVEAAEGKYRILQPGGRRKKDDGPSWALFERAPGQSVRSFEWSVEGLGEAIRMAAVADRSDVWGLK